MTRPSPTGGVPVLQLHPTRHCNLACRHCYTSSGPKARDTLALATALACLDDAVGLGYRQLAVSGGEPLLYSDLAALLARARAHDMITTVTSNGVLLTAARWRSLAPLVDVLAISIDGTPAEHDLIRASEGAFARTVANLEVVRGSGVPFGFVFTLTQHNVDSLAAVVELAAATGARSVQVHPLTVHGRAVTTMAGARPDAIELVAALVEAERLGNELDVAVHVDAVTTEQLIRHRERFVPPVPVAALTDVAPVLVIEPDGTVMPMTHELDRRFALGALETARLSELARAWLAAGRGDELATICAETWRALTATGASNEEAALYWYDRVAARSSRTATARRPPALAPAG